MTMNHIHIGTRDLKKSVEFYTELFAFKKKFDHEPGVFLDNAEGFLIAIDPVEDVPVLPGWFHFGFCLASEADVHSMYKKIKEKNIPIARDLMVKEGEFASVFILDPDGYKIEVSWHNE